MTPLTRATPLGPLVLEVLGDLAFMAADDDAPSPAPDVVWMHGRIGYRGPLSGTLECWCTRPFATNLAANLLGLDPADGEAQVRAEDALREFLNVLCGQAVTTWYGTAACVDVSIPEVGESAHAPPPAAEPSRDTCRLSFEGEPLLCFHTRERA